MQCLYHIYTDVVIASHSHNNVKQAGTAYITGYMATEGLVKMTLICNERKGTDEKDRWKT
jgi:hypothetical protein